MDNKVTKKRLNHMLSYEWIAIILVIVAIIFVWELAYSVFSVKPTLGQRFRIFYDYNVSAIQKDGFMNLIDSEDVFSYDVLEVKDERLVPNSDVLATRCETGMADVVITEIYNMHTDESKPVYTRAGEIVDNFNMYSFDRLIKEANEYVDSFKTDGALDLVKVESAFRLRMKGDNRFRTEEEIKDGILLEKGRIEQLEKDIRVVEKLIEYDKTRVLNGEESLFYNYRKYSQAVDVAVDDEAREYYTNLMASEQVENYALKLWLLTGGEKNPSNFFNSALEKEISCKNVVMMAFDMKEHKKELQYETVSLVAMVVREFTAIAG